MERMKGCSVHACMGRGLVVRHDESPCCLPPPADRYYLRGPRPSDQAFRKEGKERRWAVCVFGQEGRGMLKIFATDYG